VPEDVKTKGLRKLFIGGFGSEVQVRHLEELFSEFGSITNVYIIYDPKSKASKSRCDSQQTSATWSLKQWTKRAPPSTAVLTTSSVSG